MAGLLLPLVVGGFVTQVVSAGDVGGLDRLVLLLAGLTLVMAVTMACRPAPVPDDAATAVGLSGKQRAQLALLLCNENADDLSAQFRHTHPARIGDASVSNEPSVTSVIFTSGMARRTHWYNGSYEYR